MSLLSREVRTASRRSRSEQIPKEGSLEKSLDSGLGLCLTCPGLAGMGPLCCFCVLGAQPPRR